VGDDVMSQPVLGAAALVDRLPDAVQRLEAEARRGVAVGHQHRVVARARRRLTHTADEVEHLGTVAAVLAVDVGAVDQHVVLGAVERHHLGIDEGAQAVEDVVDVIALAVHTGDVRRGRRPASRGGPAHRSSSRSAGLTARHSPNIAGTTQGRRAAIADALGA
jgi:hypothetical protein